MKTDQQLKLLKEIFEENNQVLDKCSETNPNNQFQILSTALFNTSQYSSEIQDQCVKMLLTLVERNQLTKKLSIFNNNISLIKDYQFNQTFTGFQNINFELVSIAYQTKIIVYTITDKYSLYASIFNHKYQKTIFLFKEGLHYDVVYKQKQYEIKTFCNDLLTNLLDIHFPIDFTDAPLLNLEQEVQIFKHSINFQKVSDKLEQATSQKISPKHKKSRSQDYSQFQEKSLKSSSSVKKFCEFKMVDDSNRPTSKQSIDKIDYFTDTLGIQNYNVTNSKLSSPNNWTPFIDPQDFLDQNENNKNADFSLAVQQINGAVINHSFSEDSDNFNENFNHKNESNNSQQENNKQDSSSNQEKQNYQINTINESELLTPPPPALQTDGTFKQDVQFYSADQQKQSANFSKAQQQQQQQSVQQQPLLNQFPPFYNYYPMMYQQVPQFPMAISSKKQLNIRTDENSIRFLGRLKFFDENKNYGFLVKDDDQVDIFVHYDDLALAGMTKEFLKTSRLGNMIRFSFSCLNYVGKYDKSIKAVDLEFVPN